MKKTFSRTFFLVFAAALFLFCVTVWGESSETAGAEEGIPRTVYYQALNFFGLLIILFFVLKNKVAAHFVKRHDLLTVAIAEAARSREAAEKSHREYSVRIQNLERETQQSLEQIRKEAEETKRRLVEEAKRLAASIEQEAKRSSENEMARARAELYDETLAKALEGARGLLHKAVVETDQKRLQQEFVEKIEAVQ